MKVTISAIILAYNERLHIQRCVENVRRVAQEVFVVDCHSTDGTQEIARACGATVVEHDWPGNQAEQLNWALENLPITGDWVLRLDADEYLTEALIAELQSRLDTLSGEVAGVSFPRDVVFLGRKLRFGLPPVVLLRLWKRGKATCENRKMDEHMVLTEGTVEVFSGHFVDHNLNNLLWWTQKHLGYAQREMGDIQERAFAQGALAGQTARKRASKVSMFACRSFGAQRDILSIAILFAWVFLMVSQASSGPFCRRGGIAHWWMPCCMRTR